ncbi:MAG: response regulator [Myxococcales bacterium]|nr:response regulator [Myxococcales bacterium]
MLRPHEVEMTARVLIVDDEINARRALAIGLRLEGFEVREACDAEQALEMLDDEPLDVAIIDLMMPGMNGLELLRRIRRAHPRMRLLLTSAYHLSARQLERADVGASAFVPKPFRLDELVAFLRARTSSSAPPRGADQ